MPQLFVFFMVQVLYSFMLSNISLQCSADNDAINIITHGFVIEMWIIIHTILSITEQKKMGRTGLLVVKMIHVWFFLMSVLIFAFHEWHSTLHLFANGKMYKGILGCSHWHVKIQGRWRRQPHSLLLGGDAYHGKEIYQFHFKISQETIMYGNVGHSK